MQCHDPTADLRLLSTTMHYSVYSQKPDFVVATNDPEWRVIASSKVKVLHIGNYIFI